jgi:hypothetical protein
MRNEIRRPARKDASTTPGQYIVLRYKSITGEARCARRCPAGSKMHISGERAVNEHPLALIAGSW